MTTSAIPKPQSAILNGTGGIKREDALNLLILTAVFAAILLLIPPQHEYPVLDDSIYADTALTLHETGDFVMPGLNQSNLIGLILWGVLWTKTFGFSFTVLTYSTLFFAVVAILSFYGLARAVDVPPWGALLGSLLLAFNPLFLHLNYTFMTDVPFVALTLAACYLYLRGLQSERLALLIAGSFCAGWAFLIRQFGAFVPAAFVAYLAITGWQEKRWRWKEALAIVAVPLLSVVGWYLYKAWQQIGPTGAEEHADRHAAAFRWKAEWVRVTGLRILSAAPLLAFFAWAAVKLRLSRWWLVPACLAVMVGAMYLLDLPSEQWIPVTEQPYVAGIGPVQITFPQETFTFGTRGSILRVGGIDFFQYRQEPIWSPALWRGLWVVGVMLAALLLAKIISSAYDWTRGLVKRETISPVVALYGLGFAIFLVSIAYPNEYFDRYLLGFLPFLLLFVIRGSKEWGKVAWAYSIAALVALASFSLLLKADHISHANARWQAAEWLAARAPGVQGGFDWDNWTKRVNLDYHISDIRHDGFRVERRFQYQSLLSGGQTRYVLAEVRNNIPPLAP